jgi:hypothetical protein
MAAGTGARYHITVIETDNTPIFCGGMATVTLGRSLYVIGIFTRLCYTIVTTGAASKNLFSMNKIDHKPGVGRGMANFAWLTGRYVTNRLANGADPIVTTLTIAPDTRMGEVVHLPTVGGMTEITSLIGDYMIS